MISPISSDLSVSCAQLYHHLRTRSLVIPHYLSMPYSWVNTEYSIHLAQHHPKIDSLPLPASFSSLGGCCTQLSTFPQLHVYQWIKSQLPSRLPPDRPPPSTPPMSLHQSLQVHLQTRSVTVSQCISTLDWSQPPRASSEFTQSRPRSASPHSLDHGLPVNLPTQSIKACKFTQWWPPSANLQTRLITASKCISRVARLQPGSLDDHGLQVHLQIGSIMACTFAWS